MGAAEFQAGALDKRYTGVVVALVTANEDPQGRGRVKVKFPWYDDRTESEWCRVAYACAGPKQGLFAVPEKKSEVLVAFEHGDMRRPYVLGGLYNGKDSPPTSRKADGERDEKMFRTRGGHTLLFRDTNSDRRIEITTDGGHQVLLDDAGGTVTVTTSGGQKVVLDKTGTATVTATTVKLDASQVKLGSSAAQSIILGEAFMALFNAHVHTPGVPVTSPPVTPMTPAMFSQVTKTG
jgi:uncharacterized protein involved in type VI secretion and phage assembly